MHNDNERSNYFDQVRRLIKIESEVTSKGIIIQGHIAQLYLSLSFLLTSSLYTSPKSTD